MDKSIEQIRREIHELCGSPLDDEPDTIRMERQAPITLRCPPSSPNQDKPVSVQVA